MPKHNQGRWKSAAFQVEEPDGEVRQITVAGRVRWCLERLLAAGNDGFTSIEAPGARVSHFIWLLRHEHGLDIETRTETHGGPFSGLHASYCIRSKVTPVSATEVAA